MRAYKFQKYDLVLHTHSHTQTRTHTRASWFSEYHLNTRSFPPHFRLTQELAIMRASAIRPRRV